MLVWQTAPLAADVTVAGAIVARLFASTTGSDADWVVKLIDVSPDTVADQQRMGGYELMVAGEIMRGRYWRGWDRPAPIPPNAVTPFTVDLHQQAYTFTRGHRIMVQVQSTWFPAHDRNPQTFVPNIFEAPATDYRAQTHRVYRSARVPSRVDLDVLEPPRAEPETRGCACPRTGESRWDRRVTLVCRDPAAAYAEDRVTEAEYMAIVRSDADEVVFKPKASSGPLPILLTRTPYGTSLGSPAVGQAGGSRAVVPARRSGRGTGGRCSFGPRTGDRC